jgi:ABC-type sugar transport system permease subunit
VFEEILAITQGGPGDATWVAAWYSYKITFSPPNNFGMGAASAFILALMVAAIALVYPARGLPPGAALMFKLSRPAKLCLHLANLAGDRRHPAAARRRGHRQHPVGEVAAGRHPPHPAAGSHVRQLPADPQPGRTEGRIFEQATYLPDNIKKFYRAFANSLIVASSVTFLTLLFGALSAYTIARCAIDGRCSCCRPTSSRASCRRSC